MNHKTNNKDFNIFDENSRIVINDEESGLPNNPPRPQAPSALNRFQNYLLNLTERLRISPNMKLFLLCLIICGINFFLLLVSFPMIFISPSKILGYLSFGNILFIMSLLFYYGSNRFFGFLRDNSRFKIALIHILLIIGGLFFPMFQGYIFSFILDLALIFTTIMFILTIIPGGQSGINAMQASLFSLMPKLFKFGKK